MASRGKRRCAFGPSPSLTAPSATRLARTHSASTPRRRATSSVFSRPRVNGRSSSRRASTTRRAIRSASALSGAGSTTGHQGVFAPCAAQCHVNQVQRGPRRIPCAEAARLTAQRRTERTRETTEMLASLRLPRPAEHHPGWRRRHGPLGGRQRYWSATARAAGQLPKVLVTTLADGQSPSVSRSSASPPRRSACARDQS